MASTLSSTYFHSSSSNLYVYAPPPSHDTSLQQMPNVFVTPPEEEQDDNPPWCYFDAQDIKHSTSPDIDALDVALGFFQQTDNRSPVFHRSLANESQETVVMPKRNATKLQEAAIDYVEEVESVLGGSRRAMDEDVVEVVKVRRNEGMADVADIGASSQRMRKSKTFRARATQAFRSIKNVGKTTRRSTVSEVWPAQNNVENIVEPTNAGAAPRPTTPNLSRRKSIQLSQIFSTKSNRSSTIIPDMPMSPISTPSIPSEETLGFSSRASTSLGDRTNVPMVEEQPKARPTLSNKKSFRHRISVLDLQRLFTSSTPSTPAVPTPSTDAPPTITKLSKRESLPPPQSPPRLPDPESVDDVFLTSPTSSTSHSRPHSFHATQSSRFSLTLSTPSGSASLFPDSRVSEDHFSENSFEMRLDSLHFDSLRFDPDEF